MRSARITTGVGLFLSAVLIVSPLLATTFLGDDAFNSYLDGWLLHHHVGLGRAFLGEFVEWDVSRGRFLPILQLINVIQFHFFHEALPLKIVQTIAIGINIVTIFVLLHELTGDRIRALAGTGVALACLQIRYSFDAIVQYNLHLPTTTELALLACYFFVRSRRLHSRNNAIGAAVFFALATMTYEITIPLAFAFVAIVTAESGTVVRFRALVPFAIVLAMESCVVGFIRYQNPQPPGTAYAPAVFSIAYVATAIAQLVTTIPFLYEIVDPQTIFRAIHPITWLEPPPFATAAAAIVFVTLYFSSGATVRNEGGRFRASVPERSRVAPLAVALALFVGPAFFVAASPYYQSVIGIGRPYIPIYLQGFGLSIGASALDWVSLGAMLERLHLPSRVIGAFAVALGVATIATSNVFAAESFGSWTYPRETIVDGLTRGVGAAIPSGSTVFLDRSYIVNERFDGDVFWNSRNFYSMWLKKPVFTFPLESEAATPFETAFEIRSIANDARHGVVLVERIRRARGSTPILVDARIYERGGSETRRPTYVAPHLAARDFTMIGDGKGWAIYAFQPRCAQLPSTSLSDDSSALGKLVYGAGFSSEESENGERFRWAGSKAVLVIRNLSDRYERMRFSARVGTVGTRGGSVTISGSVSGHLPLTATGLPIDLPVSIPPLASARLYFSSPGTSVALPGDRRILRMRFISPRIRDEGGCAHSDA